MNHEFQSRSHKSHSFIKVKLDQIEFILISDAEKEIHQYLLQVNSKCERIWDKYVKYGIGGFFCSSFVSWLGPLIRLLITKEEFNTENLYVEFNIVCVFFVYLK